VLSEKPGYPHSYIDNFYQMYKLPKINPTTTATWQSLKEHTSEMKAAKMKELFAADEEKV
jgi:hypothetical protein